MEKLLVSERTPEILLMLAYIDSMAGALGHKKCRLWTKGALRSLEGMRTSTGHVDLIERHCTACGKCSDMGRR